MIKNMMIKFTVWSVLGATLVGLTGGAGAKVPQAIADNKGEAVSRVAEKKTAKLIGLPSPFSELKDPKEIEDYIGNGYRFPKTLGDGFQRKEQWRVESDQLKFYQLGYVKMGQTITLRINDPKETPDVAGDFRDQPKNHEYQVGNKKITTNENDNGILNAHWDEGGKRYTLTFDQAVTKQGLAEIVKGL